MSVRFELLYKLASLHPMKISVFGLGYVGAVSAGCLTAIGHECIGVDPTRIKIDLVNEGKDSSRREGPGGHD